MKKVLIISILVLMVGVFMRNTKLSADEEPKYAFEMTQQEWTSDNVTGMNPVDIILVTKSADVHQRDKYYWQDDREYAGIPSIAVIGKRIWAVWQTGGNTEPIPENYLILTYSDDGGETWIDSLFTFEAFTKSNNSDSPNSPYPGYDNLLIGTPLLHADNRGQLWVLFGCHNNKFCFVFRNPTADAAELEYDAPCILYTGATSASNMTVVTTEDGIEEWYFCCDQGYATETMVWVSTSTNKKKGWKIKGTAKTLCESADDKNRFHEAMFVELSDGTFWMLKRLEKGYKGGMEQAFSYDRGKTWTNYEADLGYPFQGPGSKFYFGKLENGHLLLITHDTTESRTKLCAYLSTDEGKTWPYKMMIDDRSNVSYPEVAIKDGKIYCIYDKGRITELEIRLSIFTEEDIMAGKMISEESRDKLCVTKKYNNLDLEEVITEFDKEITVQKGTQAPDIIKNLPTTLEMKDENGKSYTFEGAWSSVGYSPKTPGEYKFTFSIYNMPSNIQDVHGLACVTVNVVDNGEEKPEEKGSSGCGSSVVTSIVAGICTLSAAFFLAKKKKELE